MYDDHGHRIPHFKIDPRGDRPINAEPPSEEDRKLINDIAGRYQVWGPERIHAELVRIGRGDISSDTVRLVVEVDD